MESTAERRILILEYLCEYKHSTRENLAQEFGVSCRTIERDLLVLRCSYPIYTIQGSAGGVFIDRDYRLGKKYLTERQKILLEDLSIELSGEDLEIIKSILKQFTYTSKVSNRK